MKKSLLTAALTATIFTAIPTIHAKGVGATLGSMVMESATRSSKVFSSQSAKTIDTFLQSMHLAGKTAKDLESSLKDLAKTHVEATADVNNALSLLSKSEAQLTVGDSEKLSQILSKLAETYNSNAIQTCSTCMANGAKSTASLGLVVTKDAKIQGILAKMQGQTTAQRKKSLAESLTKLGVPQLAISKVQDEEVTALLVFLKLGAEGDAGQKLFYSKVMDFSTDATGKPTGLLAHNFWKLSIEFWKLPIEETYTAKDIAGVANLLELATPEAKKSGNYEKAFYGVLESQSRKKGNPKAAQILEDMKTNGCFFRK